MLWGESVVWDTLKKALYGTHGAPQLGGCTVKEHMLGMGGGVNASELHPSGDWHQERDIIVVVHVDDFLCIASEASPNWLCDTPKDKYDLKRSLLEPGSEREVKYLNRVLGREGGGHGGVEWECGPKHTGTLMREFGMGECEGTDTPNAKGGGDKPGT